MMTFHKSWKWPPRSAWKRMNGRIYISKDNLMWPSYINDHFLQANAEFGMNQGDWEKLLAVINSRWDTNILLRSGSMPITGHTQPGELVVGKAAGTWFKPSVPSSTFFIVPKSCAVVQRELFIPHWRERIVVKCLIRFYLEVWSIVTVFQSHQHTGLLIFIADFCYRFQFRRVYSKSPRFPDQDMAAFLWHLRTVKHRLLRS